MEEIDIKQIVQTIWDKKILVIIITIITTLEGAIYSYILQNPKYQSSISLVLTKSGDSAEGSSALTTTDVTMNQKLVGTYSEIIKSESVLGKVIDNLGLENETVGSIKSSITVKSVKDTEIINITVTNKDAEEAAMIANEIGAVFAEWVKDELKLNNVHTLDEAKIATTPYNIKHTEYLVIAFVLGIVISCVYIAIRELFDSTIKTADEIESLVDLPVIAQISNATSHVKGGRK